jgi:hypothetical protein
MAQVSKSIATLRIMGDDLSPSEITALLGHAPTESQSKGDELIGRVTGKRRIARIGIWRLAATPSEPENLDTQIAELLGKLTADMDVWNKIKKRYEVDLFCGLFMDQGNEGMSVSPSSLQSLGQRGIELALDIYGADTNATEDHA